MNAFELALRELHPELCNMVEDYIEDVKRELEKKLSASATSRIEDIVTEVKNLEYLYLVQEQDEEVYNKIYEAISDGQLNVRVYTDYYQHSSEYTIHSDMIITGEIEIQFERENFTELEWLFMKEFGTIHADTVLYYEPCYITVYYDIVE